MSRFRFSSLRARFVLVILAVMIPAMAMILYDAWDNYRTSLVQVEQEAVRLAQIAKGWQAERLNASHQLLLSLAQSRRLHEGDATGCSRLLATIIKQLPQYTLLVVVKPNGEVFCSSTPSAFSISFADRPVLRRALETRDLAIGPFRMGAVTHRPVLPFAYPLLDAKGEVQLVIGLGVDLSVVNRLVVEVFPPGAAILMVAQDGQVLSRFPDPGKWIKRVTADMPPIRLILERRGERAGRVVDIDGTERLYAFTPIRLPVGGQDIYLAVGLPVPPALAKANRNLARDLLALLGASLLAFLVGWVIVGAFVLRPVRGLMETSRRVGEGDLGARAGLPYVEGEIGQLTRAFDNMVTGLQRREAEVKQAEAEAEYRRRTAESLAEVTRAFAQTMNSYEVGRRIVESILPLLRARSASLFQMDLESGNLVIVAVAGDIERMFGLGTILKRGTGLSWLAVSEGKPVTSPNILMDPRITPTPDHRARLEHIRHTSVLTVPLFVQKNVIGVLSIGDSTERPFTAEDILLAEAFADQAAVALENARLYEEVRDGRERLERLSRRLIKAQETERRSIARELHDEMGQALTAAKINLQAMERSRTGALATRLEETIRIIDGLLYQVRELSLALRPPLLDDLGLDAALRWYFQPMGERAGLSVTVATDIGEDRLPADIETVCFRIAQEAVTNVLRHARARHMSVELQRRDGEVELAIRDDGIGFDRAAVQGQGRAGESLGLLSMEERVGLIGGRIAIESAPGRGTEVRAIFPLTLPHPDGHQALDGDRP